MNLLIAELYLCRALPELLEKKDAPSRSEAGRASSSLDESGFGGPKRHQADPAQIVAKYAQLLGFFFEMTY